MTAQPRDRIGATRGKLALVGLLAMVLVYVLWSNFAGSQEHLAITEPGSMPVVPPAVVSPSPSASKTQPEVTPGTSPFGAFAVDGSWPEPDLEVLVKFDPLSAPPWMGVVEQLDEGPCDDEAQSKSLEELQKAQNAIIFMSGKQRVARIGGEDYRIGDMVGHYKITDISSAGIVLSGPNRGASDSEK
jgi:hypothetical protein